MSNEVVMESARTLHGQLQRGLGRAARRAADRPGSGEYVYDCIRRDPRWDPQCESRGLYYARLVVDLELPAGPVAEHLFHPSDHVDDDPWRVQLALEVLSDLVRLSRREAAAPLRRYAEEGAHWQDALVELVELGDPALTLGLDELVASRCDEFDLAHLMSSGPSPVIDAWAARQPRIAEARERHRARTRDAKAARTAARAGGTRSAGGREPDRAGFADAELLDVARRRGPDAIPAIFELGRRRTLALLDLAEEVLPEGPGRLRGAVCRALSQYGPETLPRARAWTAAKGGCTDMGLRILARHGTRQDIPLLMDELRETVEKREWAGAPNPVEGLGRLRAGEAVPLLKTAWTESTYAYLRPRVLTALIRTAPHTAESYAVEGLWDCESDVREEAARFAPHTRDTRLRLQRLHHDVAEEPEVRSAAAARTIG
ncbi:hypothetical protein [Actinomadura algeriensis]|uniref:HEAT repeat domain-containing protein n=1 Tax=Actinomadura algeriensis TaxID=1679523 RepID=A0ABR9JXM7_9ACTN|nr:hypothetical protein [Actinomadura algeriensis]MBE1535329.1 hypothetical protein [Actinomadura algeriensis]